MSLSERLNRRCPVCDRLKGEPFIGWCTNYRFHVHGNVPEWRRRQLERLEKVGRVAEKALDR